MIPGKIFELEERKGQGKTLPLSEAISRWVEPGMKLHVAAGADANAAIREIIRQYQERNPEFTVISGGVTTPEMINLVGSGLVKKVITTNCSYVYPAPRPIPVDSDPVQEIASRCGWEVRAALSLEQIPPPTEAELSVLRALDPKGFFIGK